MSELSVAEEYAAVIANDSVKAGLNAGQQKAVELGFLKLLTVLEPAVVDEILRNSNLSAAFAQLAYVNYLNGLSAEAQRTASVSGNVVKRGFHQLLSVQLRDAARLSEETFLNSFASSQDDFSSAIKNIFGVTSDVASKLVAPGVGLILAYRDLEHDVNEAIADDISREIAISAIAQELSEFAVPAFASLSNVVTTAVTTGTLVVGGGVTITTASTVGLIALAASASFLLTGAFLVGQGVGTVLNDNTGIQQAVGIGIDALVDFLGADTSLEKYPGEYGSVAFLANYLDGELATETLGEILKNSAVGTGDRSELIAFYNALTFAIAPELTALNSEPNEEEFLDAVVASLQAAKEKQLSLELEFSSTSAISLADFTEMAQAADGIAYRYALRELNPFVLSRRDSIYDSHNAESANQIRSLDPVNYSDAYIRDRRSMLGWKLVKNGGDLDLLSGPGLKTYDDRITGETITISQSGGLHPDPTARIIFGSDESENGVGISAIVGSNDIDRIYGGLGNDVIKGGGGNDYLDGGSGDDSIIGGAGIDTLVGGVGEDILHLEVGPSPFIGDSDAEDVDGGAGNDQYWGLSGGDTAIDESGIDGYYVTFGSGSERSSAAISDADGRGTIFYADGLALTGGELVQSTTNLSTYEDGEFTYRYATDGAESRLTISRSGFAGSVVVKNFIDGDLGIEFDSAVIPDVSHFQGTAGGESIFDSLGGTRISRFGDDRTNDLVTFTSVVQRIDGLGGDDNIQIDSEIPGVVIFGDSAFASVGIDGDDFIEVDRLNVDAGLVPLASTNGATIYGEGGDDFIGGSQRADWLFGGIDHDFISGRHSRDNISGGIGNDWLQGGAGNDVIFGHEDNDRLFGGGGIDALNGGSGNDQLWGDAGDAPFFRVGTDTFWDGATETITVPIVPDGFGDQPPVSKDADLGDGAGDVLEGGAGDDFLYGGEGSDFLYGQDDNDVLQGEAGDDWLFGGDQNDVLWGDKDPASYDTDTTPFTPQGHVMREHADGKDVIGNDHLDGDRGNDELYGGAGNDRYYFGYGDGNDVIDDKAGIDSIRLKERILSNDVKLTESGGDLIVQLFSDGTPTGDQLIVTAWFTGKPVESIVIDETTILTVADIEAATGRTSEPADGLVNEELNLVLLTELADSSLEGATPGADTIYGLGGDDVIAGGGGEDRLIGGDGDDELSGGNDNDALVGELGNDSLYGHTGDDVLIGGIGDDNLVGGTGNDTYLFNRGNGDDFILDDGGLSDRIAFGKGISVDDLTIDVWDDTLLLDVREHGELVGDRITVVDGFLSGTQIETIEFRDGTILDTTAINALLPDSYALDDGVNAIGGENVTTYTLDTQLNHGFSILIDDAGGIDTLDLKVITFGSPSLTPALNSSSRDGKDLLLDVTIDSTVSTIPDATGEIRIVDFYTDDGFIETIKFGDTTLNIPNIAPLASGAIVDQVIGVDVAYSFTVSVDTFTDNPYDHLRYDARLADGSDLPAWLSFDSATQTFSGTPSSGDEKIVGLQVTAIDSKDLSTSLMFNLNIGDINVAPSVAVPLNDLSIDEGTSLNLAVPAGTFVDPNLVDSLTVTATDLNGGALPAWLNYETFTQTFSGTPSATDVGLVAVKLNATDVGGLSATETFLINVDYLNDAPVVDLPAFDQNATEQVPFAFAVPAATFSDPDNRHGDTLRYTATLSDGSELPGWMLFDPSTLTFSGRPVAIFGDTDYTIRVTATDDNDAIATTDFNFNVAESLGARQWFVPHDIDTAGGSAYSRSGSVSAALSSGGYVTVWTAKDRDGDGSGIFAQRFNANGDKQGSVLAVNTTIASDQETASVTGLANGGFVVTWGSQHEDDGLQTEYGRGGGVYARQFNASGSPLSAEFQVNPVYSGVQDEPTVAALADGGYVIAWYSQFDTQHNNNAEYGSGDRGFFSQRYSASGAASGDGVRLLNGAGIGADDPAIAGLLGGGYVLAWRGSDAVSGGISAQRFSASGAAQGNEIAVNSVVTDLQQSPTITALETGGFVIVWQSENQDEYGGAGIFGQRYNDVGMLLGNEFQVNTTTLNSQSDPSVDATPDGGFVVTWISSVATTNGVGNIYAQQFDGAGLKAGGETRIDEDAFLNDNPSVTVLIDGSIAYSWTTTNGGSTSSSGGPEILDDPSRIETRVVELRPNTAITAISSTVDLVTTQYKNLTYQVMDNMFSDPDVAFGDSVSFTALLTGSDLMPGWLSFDSTTGIFSGLPLNGDLGSFGITVSAMDISGNSADAILNIDVTSGSDIVVTPEPSTFVVNTTEPRTDSSPAATTLDDGSEVIVWIADTAIYGQRFAADGSVLGGEFRIDEGSTHSLDPTITNIAGGGFVVGWLRSDGKIVARQYDGAGSATGAEFVIKDDPNATFGDGSLIALDIGGFWAAWRAPSTVPQFDDLWVQRFSADLVPVAIGAEVLVGSVPMGGEPPVLAGLTNDELIVAWSAEDASGKRTIYGQRFDSNGVAVGDEFQVSGNSIFSQFDPFAIGLADGSFLITWTTDHGNGDEDIYGQLFDAHGSARGTQWRINNYTSTPQRFSSISATADGGFVVAWHVEQFNTSNSEYGFIQAQHFDNDGNPTGDGFTVTQSMRGSANIGRPAITTADDGGFTIYWDSGNFVEENLVGDSILGRRFNVGGSGLDVPPVVSSPIADQSSGEDTAYSFFVPPGTITDPDLDELTYRATLAGGNALPNWLLFDALTQELHGTPTDGDVGTYAISIVGTDPSGKAVADTFTLTVDNAQDAPIAVSDTAGLRLDTGTKTITLDVLANDTDVDLGDDPSTFTVDTVSVVGGLGSAMIVNNQLFFDAGSDFEGLSPTDIQNVTVNYTMSDAVGLTSQSLVSIAIHDGTVEFGTDNDEVVHLSVPTNYYGFGGNDTVILGVGSSGSHVTIGGTFGATTVHVSPGSGSSSIGRSIGPGIPGVVSFTGLPYSGMSIGIGSLLLMFDGSDVALHLEDFDPNDALGGPRTIGTFIFDGIEYSYEEIVARGFDIAGTAVSDSLTGTNVVDRVLGLAGNDLLSTGEGDDTLTGGLGDDTLLGGVGGDTYVFSGGDGHDTITDAGGGDRVVFTAGLSSAAAVSTRVGDNLVLTLNASDSLTVTDWYLDPASRIESFIFTEDNLRIVDHELVQTIDANHAPVVAISIADHIATQGVAYRFSLPIATFDDLDLDDVLSYSATRNGDPVLPTWLSFDGVTQTFRGTPLSGDAGILDITVTATDNAGLFVSDSFALTIESTNSAPVVVAAIQDQSLTEGDTFSYFVTSNTFVDPDPGDNLSLTATRSDGTPLPGWLVFNAQTNTFNGEVPAGAGDLSIKVTATDSFGLSVSDSFQFAISDELNLIQGTPGDDTLDGTPLADHINGLDGHDIINPGLGYDVVFAGSGNDLITDLEGNNEIHGGRNNDAITTGNGDDVIYGDAHDDTIDAGDGANRVKGGHGADVITTGSGADWINGGRQHDTINPGSGDDVVFGGSGDDLITDLKGNNEIHGGRNDDTITTGDGDDVIYGNPHDDTIDAGDGTNHVKGGHGNDVITTGSGNDYIDGGINSDTINSGAGNDSLKGGYGADYLSGGEGDDVLAGGHGDDTYHFERFDGNDDVFETGVTAGDVIEFGSSIATHQIWFSQSGVDLRLDLVGTSDSVTVQDWYRNDESVETFRLDDGTYLLNSDVDQLVQAMAAFSIPMGPDTSLPLPVATVVDPVITAVWQSA